MPGKARTRIGGGLRSLRVQGAVLITVLIALPFLIFTVLGRADTERRMLLLNAVGETGDAIAAGLAGPLRDLRPADSDALRLALSRFSGAQRSIQILLRPAQATSAQDFYLMATDTPASSALLEVDRQRIIGLGILPDLSQGCTTRFLRARDASLLRDGTEVLTSVTSVQGAAGCWAIVIGTGEQRVLGAIQAGPYWRRPEVRVAAAIYILLALLIAAIFAGVWFALLRFRRLALSSTDQALFALNTDIPELAPLASAFDGMVRRLRNSAGMLRQAAEDNAHAFKGPIGTIRHAIERQQRHPTPGEQPSNSAAEVITAALDRLDGLVQSARYLDNAAAELLEPQRTKIDLSALVRTFMDSYASMNATRSVVFQTEIAEDVSVAAQEEALETILENLVDNAVGFSPIGGHLTVRLAIHGREAVMSVEDEGPGVAPDRLDRIFDRYYSNRANQPKEHADAAGEQHFGIGLWMVKQNTVSFGGTIGAHNRQPHGLAVTVTLPAV